MQITIARRDDENHVAQSNPRFMVFAHRVGAKVHFCDTRAEANAMAARVRAYEAKRANQTKGANR